MSDLELTLAIQGQDASEETMFSLQDWIQQEEISGLKQVHPKISQAQSGKMGVDPITVLSLFWLPKPLLSWLRPFIFGSSPLAQG